MTLPWQNNQEDQGLANFISYKRGKEEDRLVTWAMENYRRIKNDRNALERQWYTNMAFYFGKQNIQVLPTTANAGGNNFRLHTPAAPPWRVRLVSNKIRPMFRTELAKVTAQKPTSMVIPASDDDKDIFAARAGEQLWEATYQRKRVKSIMRRALYWTLMTGTSFTKHWWDPTMQTTDWQMPGDFVLEAETPFHVFIPDFQEEELENQPYLIHASAKSAEWVRQRYDGDFNPTTAASHDLLDDAFISMIGGTQNKNSVLCLEVWVKPGSLGILPNGGMFTILGDKIAQITEGLPFNHGEFPFSKYSHIPTGRFYADSTITDLIPLQKEYNRTRSQIIEAKNRMAKPQLLAARGSVNVSQMTNEPGQVILFTPGFQPPTPLPLQGLPAYVLEELNRVSQDMDDISGQHEVTKGRVPPGVTAATAISYLQEQDDSKLSHTIDSIEDGVEKMARQILSYVGQFWEVERIIKVIGESGSFDALSLKGSDLRGNTDIRVEAGSALPTSKAAKQAFIMDLMKMGFIPPDKGLQVLEIGGINKLYDDIQTDMRQAQRENLRMQNGQPVSTNTWDNHQLHIEVHNKFRKGQTFENLDPQLKMLFEQHVQMHQIVMMGGVQPIPVAPGQQEQGAIGTSLPALPPGVGAGPNQQPNEGDQNG